MKFKLILLQGLILSIVIASCSQSVVDDRTTLEEDKLLGKWKEVVDKIPQLDSTGTVIDSIDIAAEYEFFSDSTFSCSNEFWLNNTYGVWKLDSFETHLFLYPGVAEINSLNPQLEAVETWFLDLLTTEDMIVEHYHQSIVIGDTTTIFLQRKFYKND